MTIHLIKGTASPTVIPIEIGCHFIDTVNKKSYISVGTSSISDWKETAGGGGGPGGSVDSVFGRIGTVTAQAGDYTAAQVGAYTTAQVDTALAGKVSTNAAITGGTKTKITYDSKGLIVFGTDLVPDDIPSFVGASAGSSGTKGGVPTSLPGDQLKFLRADGTWQTVSGGGGAVSSVQGRTGDVVISKADIGLSLVDNTSDANKPVSSATQTALDNKVTANSAIIAGTATKITYDAKGLVTAGGTLLGTDLPVFSGSLTPGSPGTQGSVPAPNDTDSLKFLRGDGTWVAVTAGVSSVNGQTGVVSLTKTDIGLGNVDNTSDTNKPVSSATQTALDAKVTGNAAIISGTATKITYDAKGLVTAGTSLALSDIPAFAPASAGSGGSLGGVPTSSPGDQLKFLRADGTWQTVSGGGGGTPAGSNTWVQFNNSGAFGASVNFTWDAVNGLTVTGSDISAATPALTVRDSTAAIEFQVRNSGLLTGTTIDTGTVTNTVRIGVTTASTVAHSDSVIIGRSAGVGAGTATASNNVFIGSISGNKITTASSCVGVGQSSLTNLTTGGNNTAIGLNALRVITTGSSCTAVGSGALNNNTGGNNTAVGASAGTANIDGVNNIFIGQFCAAGLQYAQSSIYIGAACVGTNGTSGAKTINEIIIGTGTTGRGNNTVTIGSTSTSSNQFWGDIFLAGSGKGIRLISPNGSVTKTLTIDNTGAIALL